MEMLTFWPSFANSVAQCNPKQCKGCCDLLFANKMNMHYGKRNIVYNVF